MKIWKWELNTGHLQTLSMPEKARIMHVAMGPASRPIYEPSAISLWAEVDESFEIEERVIEVLTTGQEVPDAERRYIGTVVKGASVMHIYERLSDSKQTEGEDSE